MPKCLTSDPDCIVPLQQATLLATDMDGTLTQDEQFTPLLLQTLSQLAELSFPVLIVTGRSAGWVQGLAYYLPVAGAIAENGGVFYHSGSQAQDLLVAIDSIPQHRQNLAEMFQHLRQRFPDLKESSDNCFRCTDWTFDVQGLTIDDLNWMAQCCQEAGWSFTYSTVQCHIRPAQQDKAEGLCEVLRRYFPSISRDTVITIGDSLNDESLFNRDRFPLSVGVANLKNYIDRLQHRPTFITQEPEVAGFYELVQIIFASRT